jgi:hypothetical protein
MGGFEHLVGRRGDPAALVGLLGYHATEEGAVRASLAKGRYAGGGGGRGMTRLREFRNRGLGGVSGMTWRAPAHYVVDNAASPRYPVCF